MPGLYSINTRAPGTLITALIYNADHQDHVDGRAAEFMQSYSVSVAQMNVTEDPLPGGVESLPITLAGEIARLRFEIAAIKTSLNGDAPTQWYSPVTSPALPVVGARVQRPSAQVIPDGVSTAVNFTSANVDFNQGGCWSPVNPTRFTAPVDGKYYVACCVKWAGANANQRRQLTIQPTPGVTDFQQTSQTGALGTDMFQCVASIMNLAATDYVEFFVLQDTGAPLNLLVDDEQAPVGSIVFFGGNP